MGVGGQSHAAVTLFPGKSADRLTYFTEGWVDPRTGLDGYEEKIHCLHQSSNSKPSSL
jgi:hypothetical protein